jgi:hypothetical protein
MRVLPGKEAHLHEATQTVNIDGKICVRADEIKEFWDRAEAGEFAKVVVSPRRKIRA